MSRPKGFTLIEVLIAGTILLGLLVAIGDLFWAHQRSFTKTGNRSNALRSAAIILNGLAQRVRPAFYISNIGSSTGDLQATTAILFPPPPYVQPPTDALGNYTSTEEHCITLAEDPFGNQNSLLTIHFYRPTGPDGGKIYIYKGGPTSPGCPPLPSTGANILATGTGTAIENLEMWWERSWVVFRLTIRDRNGNLVQNNTAAYVRYYD